MVPERLHVLYCRGPCIAAPSRLLRSSLLQSPGVPSDLLQDEAQQAVCLFAAETIAHLNDGMGRVAEL
jgi:hypothetical protein